MSLFIRKYHKGKQDLNLFIEPAIRPGLYIHAAAAQAAVSFRNFQTRPT